MSYGGGHVPRAQDARDEDTRTQKREQEILATTTVGTSDLDGTVRVNIPSSRLRVKIAIGFWGDGGAVLVDPLGTVQFVPMVVDRQGVETAMEPRPTVSLPQAIEADSAADVVVARIHLNLQGFTPQGTGAIKAVVTWEPTNEMSTEEWSAVRQRCTMMHTFPAGAGIVAGGG